MQGPKPEEPSEELRYAQKILQSPVQGMEDVIDLTDDFEIAVGIIRIVGAGRRVAIWNGPEAEVRNMGPQEARRFARELAESEGGGALEPVIAALRSRADIVQGVA